MTRNTAKNYEAIIKSKARELRGLIAASPRSRAVYTITVVKDGESCELEMTVKKMEARQFFNADVVVPEGVMVRRHCLPVDDAQPMR